MADVHTRAARAAGAHVTSILSSSPESTQRAADRLGIPAAAIGLDSVLLDQSVDAVHICTPNATHLPLAVAALEAGKHVICEKPLATTPEDAAAMAEAATRAGRVATVPFVYRFHAMVREARARVADGSVGRVISILSSYLQDWMLLQTDGNWRVDAKSGGPSRAFADIGSHAVDLIEFVTGDRISRVQATTRTVYPSRPGAAEITTEDLAAMVFITTRGAVGTLLVTQLAAGRKNALSFEIHGTQESLRFDQEDPDRLWVGTRQAMSQFSRDAGVLRHEAARLCRVPAGHTQGYQDAFNAFVSDTYSAIRGFSPHGLPTFADGARAADVTAAVLRSAETASWIELQPDEAKIR
jgi:predicted dehydrogenase